MIEEGPNEKNGMFDAAEDIETCASASINACAAVLASESSFSSFVLVMAFTGLRLGMPCWLHQTGKSVLP